MTRTHYLLLSAIGFFIVEAFLFLRIDLPLSETLRALDASHPAAINFFRAYTDLGKSPWYLWPSGIGVILCAIGMRLKAIQKHRKKLAEAGRDLLFLFLSIAIAGILTDIVKPILGRARPVEWLRDQAYGFHPLTFHAAWNSMPSGHSTTAGALACALSLLYPRARPVWIAYGFALATSRVMVNAHYLSDVLAGSLVGVLTALALAKYSQGTFPIVNGIFPIDSNKSTS